MEKPVRSWRGFASMTPEQQREIASKGGKAVQALRKAHKWTSEEAQAAGRKGGMMRRDRAAQKRDIELVRIFSEKRLEEKNER